LIAWKVSETGRAAGGNAVFVFCGRQNPEGAALLAQTGHESRFNIRGTGERPFSRVHGGLRFEMGIGTMTERTLVDLTSRQHHRLERFFMNRAAI
jgi:hypothetical protein